MLLEELALCDFARQPRHAVIRRLLRSRPFWASWLWAWSESFMPRCQSPAEIRWHSSLLIACKPTTVWIVWCTLWWCCRRHCGSWGKCRCWLRSCELHALHERKQWPSLRCWLRACHLAHLTLCCVGDLWPLWRSQQFLWRTNANHVTKQRRCASRVFHVEILCWTLLWHRWWWWLWLVAL
jgi:hypothetical protein